MVIESHEVAEITADDRDVPQRMKAWVLGDQHQMKLIEKRVPTPGPAEVLVKIGAVAVCHTDVEVLHHGRPAMVEGEEPFNKDLVMGHEYMGTIAQVGPGVVGWQAGDRIAVEVHAGCGRCQRCREGMYTSCHNYSYRSRGHRANGFTTDGGFAEYAVNNINTLVRVPDHMSDAAATLIVTAGTAMYGLDVLGGLLAGRSVAVAGAGPIGLMFVAVAKALGAGPVILSEPRADRRDMAQTLGADFVVDPTAVDAVEEVRSLTGGLGADHAIEASGAPVAVNQVLHMTNRGGRVCLAAFSNALVPTDLAYLVSNNIYMFGIRGEGRSAVKRVAALLAQKRFDPSPMHTHTFPLEQANTALSYAENQTDGAIKVVIKPC